MQKPDEKSDSILKTENRFRSGGIGESELIIHLYPDRSDLVKHIIENNGGWSFIESFETSAKLKICSKSIPNLAESPRLDLLAMIFNSTIIEINEDKFWIS